MRRRVHTGAAMEGQSEDCPDTTLCSPIRPTSSSRNGGAVGRLPGRGESPGLHTAGSLAAMEGQSEDCPDHGPERGQPPDDRAAMEGQSEDCPDDGVYTRPPIRPACRNGGAVGRLPGPLTEPSAPHTRPEPQWRGSRKTARTYASSQRPVPAPRAAMEGQSEDCPD